MLTSKDAQFGPNSNIKSNIIDILREIEVNFIYIVA